MRGSFDHIIPFMRMGSLGSMSEGCMAVCAISTASDVSGAVHATALNDVHEARVCEACLRESDGEVLKL